VPNVDRATSAEVGGIAADAIVAMLAIAAVQSAPEAWRRVMTLFMLFSSLDRYWVRRDVPSPLQPEATSGRRSRSLVM